VDPVAALDAGFLLEPLEMAELRLVAPDHLGGDDEIGLEREFGKRLGEEIVVAIREHGELPAGVAQRAERRGHVAVERQLAPFPDDHVRLPLGEREADLPRALLQARREHVLVEAVRALRFDRSLELVVGADQLVGPRSRDRREGAPVPAVPIHQGSEAVERNPAISAHGITHLLFRLRDSTARGGRS